MLKYFNKDKKKQPQFQGILTEEEFFDRKEFEISTDFWKMNNTQLEDVANKQEKYIKNLRKNYAQIQEYITNEMQKAEEEKRKLRNEVEELQIKNEANIQQKSLMETQFKDMYEKQQKQTEVVDLLDLASVGDVKQQELNKLRDQMISVCEEMRKLKEENDDLSAALEGEKIHKEKQIQNKQQIIDKLESQLKEKEQQYNKKVDELEQEVIQLQTEINEYILRSSQVQNLDQQYKDLDNKMMQEKLRADQYKKDITRLEEQIKELKLQIEQYSTDYMVIVGKAKLLEQKRVKYKQQIQQQQNEINQMKEQYQQNNLKLINENNKLRQQILQLNDQLKEIQDKQQLETAKPVEENKEEQFKHSQLELKLQDANLQNYNLQKQIINLEKQIDQITDEKDKIISHLNQKRENAIQEIELLNKRLTKSCQNSSTDISIDRNIPHHKEQKPNKRIQIFPTLNASLIELRKIEDACYKIFIQFMIQSETNKDYIVKMEMHLNDISRRTQDLLDLLEELGLK